MGGAQSAFAPASRRPIQLDVVQLCETQKVRLWVWWVCVDDGEVVYAMGQWIVDAMRFQKIYGLNTAECHKVEKWSGRLGSGWIWWV